MDTGWPMGGTTKLSVAVPTKLGVNERTDETPLKITGRLWPSSTMT